jgi:hypothetical protein
MQLCQQLGSESQLAKTYMWSKRIFTCESVCMFVRGARMFLRSHTFTVLSSEPEMMCSERLNAAQVTDSVWPCHKKKYFLNLFVLRLWDDKYGISN